MPQTLIDQLADNGIMVLPLGPHDGAQHIVKLPSRKRASSGKNLIAVRFVPLLPGRRGNCDVWRRRGDLVQPTVTFLPDTHAFRNDPLILKALFTHCCFISNSTFVVCE